MGTGAPGLSELEVQRLEGFPRERRAESGGGRGERGRKGPWRPAPLLVLASSTGGLCAGLREELSEDGQAAGAGLSPLRGRPAPSPPQNQAPHSSCTEGRPRRKAKVSFWCVA